jgi:hypothetical protein
VINEFRYHVQKFSYKASQEGRELNVVAESQKPLHHLLFAAVSWFVAAGSQRFVTPGNSTNIPSTALEGYWKPNVIEQTQNIRSFKFPSTNALACLAEKRRDTNLTEESEYPKMLMGSKYFGLIGLMKKKI